VAGDRARASSGLELVEAEVADARELPFDDEAFDVVIANHMLYHVPAPETAVAELARVLRPDGVLMAATSGPRHLRELWEIRAEVFGGPPRSLNTEVFGSVTGASILRAFFSNVEWREYADTLRCTSVDDVVAFLTSSPPGEDASPDQLMVLWRTGSTPAGVCSLWPRRRGCCWPGTGSRPWERPPLRCRADTSPHGGERWPTLT
jgi:SAM-dependent methyltransferase